MTRTTEIYRGVSIRTPEPYGAAGLAWQNNFTALADRIGNHIEAAANPTANDDAANTGGNGAVMYLSTWRNTATGGLFVCTDAADGAAVWSPVTTDWANVAIAGGTINGTTIGATTPAAGAFTSLRAANDQSLAFRDAGGVYRDMVKLNSSNNQLFGSTASNHMWFYAGASRSINWYNNGRTNLTLSTTGNLELPNDNQKLALGAAGTADSYLNYTGSGLYGWADGGIRLDPYVGVGYAANSLYPLRVGGTKDGTSLAALYANTFIQLNNNSTIANNLTALQFAGLNTSGAEVTVAAIASRITDRTAGTVDGDLIITTTRNNTSTHAMTIKSTGAVGIGEEAPDYTLDVNGPVGFTPGASVTPVDNGDVVIEFTNNTTLTIRARGSDGIVRSVALTLSP